MRGTGLILILFLAQLSRGQAPLSFESGGKEACARAIHQPVPNISGEAARSFTDACYRHDLDLQAPLFIALSKSMDAAPPQQRIAFNALVVSFAAFRDAAYDEGSCANSRSPSDSTCKTIALQARVMANSQFLQMAEGKLAIPPASSDDLVKADAELNTSYDNLFAAFSCEGTAAVCASQNRLQNIERAWIRYRDAWMAFAALRWPQRSPSDWRTYFTKARASELASQAGSQ